MTREEVREEILEVSSPSILCELPTSFGKSKIALDLINKRVIETGNSNPEILVVIPRLVLIDNWKEEFRKWGYESLLPFVTFVTYVSFPKKLYEKNWDIVVFDECHHLSERCREAISTCTEEIGITSHTFIILLSATVGRDLRKELKALFPDLYIHKVSARKAIDEEVLPDPRVYLIPLSLDRTYVTHKIVKNPSQKIEITCPYVDRWKYKGIKNRRIVITCTQRQYYDDMSSMIEWYRKKMFSETFKNLFLRKSGERLKWLSEQKSAYVKTLLDLLGGQRTLTFCNGIPQTEELGKYCINSSKSKKANQENLTLFNTGIVNHITACNMLDEGMNLTNCRVGIYAVLNSSDRMIAQKLGRLLRHPDPVIIIPYYRGTREEELVQKMMENYNPELVTTITSLTELTL